MQPVIFFEGVHQPSPAVLVQLQLGQFFRLHGFQHIGNSRGLRGLYIVWMFRSFLGKGAFLQIQVGFDFRIFVTDSEAEENGEV